MKGGEKARLGVVRLMLAAVKQREADERIELDDAQVLAVLDKMVKQRRDSIAQYTAAGRQDLADTEAAEIAVIQEFLPESLSEDEILAIIAAAIAESGVDKAAVMRQHRVSMDMRAEIVAGETHPLYRNRLCLLKRADDQRQAAQQPRTIILGKPGNRLLYHRWSIRHPLGQRSARPRHLDHSCPAIIGITSAPYKPLTIECSDAIAQTGL